MSKPDPHASDAFDDDFDIFAEADAEFEARADAEAEADVAAGRVAPHEEVAEWLKTWGTPEFKPAPRHWLK